MQLGLTIEISSIELWARYWTLQSLRASWCLNSVSERNTVCWTHLGQRRTVKFRCSLHWCNHPVIFIPDSWSYLAPSDSLSTTLATRRKRLIQSILFQSSSIDYYLISLKSLYDRRKQRAGSAACIRAFEWGLNIQCSDATWDADPQPVRAASIEVPLDFPVQAATGQRWQVVGTEITTGCLPHLHPPTQLPHSDREARHLPSSEQASRLRHRG